jgi:hypothetical protein
MLSINRADRVNHMSCRKQPTRCNDGFARRQPLRIPGTTYLPALLQNTWPASEMNCAVNASAAQQRRVGRIDQSVHPLPRNVADEEAHAPI